MTTDLRQDTFTVDLTGISILISDGCFPAARTLIDQLREKIGTPKADLEQNALRELKMCEQRLVAAKLAKKI